MTQLSSDNIYQITNQYAFEISRTKSDKISYIKDCQIHNTIFEILLSSFSTFTHEQRIFHFINGECKHIDDLTTGHKRLLFRIQNTPATINFHFTPISMKQLKSIFVHMLLLKGKNQHKRYRKMQAK